MLKDDLPSPYWCMVLKVEIGSIMEHPFAFTTFKIIILVNGNSNIYLDAKNKLLV